MTEKRLNILVISRLFDPFTFTYTLVKVQTREGVGNPNNQSLVFQFLILSKKYRQRIKYTRYDQNI